MTLIEWIAGALIVLGIHQYGKQSLFGPVLSIIGCIVWAIIAWHHGMIAMLVLNLILTATNCWNLIKQVWPEWAAKEFEL